MRRNRNVNTLPTPSPSPSRERSNSGAPRISDIVFDADSESWSKVKRVWILDDKDGCISAHLADESINLQETVKQNPNEMIRVILEDGSDRMIKACRVEPMNPPKFDKSEDLSNLSYLNESSVFANLRDRFYSDLIYTYSGLFLVAFNPWKDLNVYSDEIMTQYRGRSREDLPPHIFSICDEAYRDMLENGANQTILITGESGAGKTVNTNKVIQYFSKSGHLSSTSFGTQLQNIESKIIEATPILEAFGNAKTIRNHNSSRFGKFIRLQFDKAGILVGADIEHYLLEKGRVIHHDNQERSFHIFYQLLAGFSDELKEKFMLLDISKYRLLEGVTEVEALDDVADFKHVLSGLKIMGISDDEISSIWRILSAVLLFGNVEFYSSNTDDGACFKDSNTVETLCRILGIDFQQFKTNLLSPTIKAGDTIVNTFVSPEKAFSMSQALSKGIYERLFKWIVEKINISLKGKSSYNSFIGVLDIAGFEIFENNSFEQFCINFTNEKLQQFFNHRMFVLEQSIYQTEGIDWKFIDFGLDLQSTIDLIEQPLGILSILDEECLFPKANDETFLQKLLQRHEKKTPSFSSVRFKQSSFMCKHYAGDVIYETSGWLFKNKDPIDENLTALFAKSDNSILCNLFKEFAQSKSPRAESSVPRKKGSQFITVSQRYRVQLNDLMYNLQKTTPHFVRCIVPNNEKKPGIISSQLVMAQLRCNGVLEGIRITRMGFPSRVKFGDFKQRYEILTKTKRGNYNSMDPKTASTNLIKDFGVFDEEYRIGKTMIFLKAGTLARLEEERNVILSRTIILFQGKCRGFLSRRKFLMSKIKETQIRIIQRNVREYMEFKNDPWWKLYCRIKPLLGFHAQERKQTELLDKIKLLESQLKQATAEKQEMERSYANDKKRLLDENDEISAALEEMIDALTRMEETRANQVIEINDLYANVQDLTNRNEALNSCNEASASDVLKLKKEVELRDVKINNISEAHRKQVEMFEQLKNQLNVDLDECQANLLAKSASLNSLEEKWDEAQKEKNLLMGKISDLQAKLKELSQTIKNKDKSIKKNQDEHENLQSEISELMIELGKLREFKNVAQAQIEQLDHDLKVANKSKISLESEAEKLRKDLVEAKFQLSNLNSERNDLQKEIDILREELEDNTNADTAIRNVQDQMQTKITSLKRTFEEESDMLKSQLKDSQKEKNAAIELAESELSEWKRLVNRLKEEKEDVHMQLNVIRGKYEELVSAKQISDRITRQLQSEKNSLESNLSAKITEVNELQSFIVSLKNKQEESNSMRRISVNEESQLRSMAVFKAEKDAEIDNLLLEKKRLEDMLKSKSDSISAMELELESMVEQLESQDHGIREKSRLIEMKEDEIRKMRRSLEDIEKQSIEHQELKQRVLELNEAHDIIVIKSENLKKRNDELQAKCEELTNKLTENLSWRNQYEEKKRSISKSSDVSAREMEAEKSKRQELELENQQLLIKISDLMYAAEISQEEITKYRNQIRKQVVELREAKEALLNHENDTIQRLRWEKSEADAALREVNLKMQELEISRSQLELILKDKEAKISQLQDDLNEFQTFRINSSNDDLKIWKEEIEKLRSKEIEMEAKNNSLISERNRLELKIGDIISQAEESNRLLMDSKLHNKQSEAFAKQLQMNLDVSTKEFSDLKSKNELILKKLDHRSLEIRDLELKYQLLCSENSEKEKIVDTLSSNIQKLQLELESENERRVRTEHELTAAEDSKKQLLVQLKELEAQLNSSRTDLKNSRKSTEQSERDLLEKFSSQKSLLERRIYELEINLSNLQSQNALLKSKESNVNLEFVTLKKRIVDLKSENSSLQERNLKLIRGTSQSKHSLKVMAEELAQVKDLLRLAEEEKENTKSSSQNSLDVKRELESKYNLLRLKLDHKEYEIKIVNQDMENLTLRYSRLNAENLELTGQIDDLRDDFEGIAQQKRMFEDEVGKLRNHLEIQEFKFAHDLKEANRAKELECGQLKRKFDTINDALKEATTSLMSLEENYERTSRELIEEKKKGDEASKQLSEVTKLFQHSCLRTQQLEEQLDESISLLKSLQEEYENLSMAHDPLKASLREYQGLNAELTTLNQEIESKLIQSSKQRDEISQKFEELLSQQTQEREEVEHAISCAQIREDQISHLEKELSHVKSNLESSSRKLYDLQSERDEQKKTIHRLNAEIELLVSSEYDRDKAELSVIQDRVCSLENQLKETISELIQVTDEKRRLQKELGVVSKSNDTIMRERMEKLQKDWEDREQMLLKIQRDLQVRVEETRAMMEDYQDQAKRYSVLLLQERFRVRNLERENDIMRSKDLQIKIAANIYSDDEIDENSAEEQGN